MATAAEGPADDARSDEPWGAVVGQPAAVAALRAAAVHPVHAYLFVGASGSGTRAAARAFSAELISRGSDPAEVARQRRLVAADQHPDVSVVERVGAAISVGAAEEIIRRASLTPAEGATKVMVLADFHLVAPPAAAKLLKTIEEPPPNTFFIVLAEEVTPDLVTIASRCNRIDFPPLTDAAVVEGLVADGVEPARAAEVASVAHGDLERARLLATDERLALRLALWRDLPGKLDGSGHVAAGMVDEVRATIDDALQPLLARQAAEAAALQERIDRYGQRGSGARELEERHRREQRRLRTDELRLGLAELARRYRDGLTTSADPDPLLDGLAAIQATAEGLVRNPSEELALQALFLRLPRLV